MKPARQIWTDVSEADLCKIVARSVLDRSPAIEPFTVRFDPKCNFCKKNRQIVLINEEYEHPEPTFIKRLEHIYE